MRKNRLYIFLLALLSVTTVFADNMPTINPTAIFTTADGEETGTSYSGSAPLPVRFLPTQRTQADGTPTMNGVSRWKDRKNHILNATSKTPNIPSTKPVHTGLCFMPSSHKTAIPWLTQMNIGQMLNH